jgi:hypothetical protein
LQVTFVRELCQLLIFDSDLRLLALCSIGPVRPPPRCSAVISSHETLRQNESVVRQVVLEPIKTWHIAYCSATRMRIDNEDGMFESTRTAPARRHPLWLAFIWSVMIRGGTDSNETPCPSGRGSANLFYHHTHIKKDGPTARSILELQPIPQQASDSIWIMKETYLQGHKELDLSPSDCRLLS